MPTPHRKSRPITPQSTDKEPLYPSAAIDVEQRIDNLELAISRMKEYIEESPPQFPVFFFFFFFILFYFFFIILTKSVKESTERIVRSYDKPSEEDTRIETGSDRFVPD